MFQTGVVSLLVRWIVFLFFSQFLLFCSIPSTPADNRMNDQCCSSPVKVRTSAWLTLWWDFKRALHKHKPANVSDLKQCWKVSVFHTLLLHCINDDMVWLSRVVIFVLLCCYYEQNPNPALTTRTSAAHRALETFNWLQQTGLASFVCCSHNF